MVYWPIYLLSVLLLLSRFRGCFTAPRSNALQRTYEHNNSNTYDYTVGVQQQYSDAISVSDTPQANSVQKNVQVSEPKSKSRQDKWRPKTRRDDADDDLVLYVEQDAKRVYML